MNRECSGYIDADYLDIVNMPRDKRAHRRRNRLKTTIEERDVINPAWPGIAITDDPLLGIIPGSDMWE